MIKKYEEVNGFYGNGTACTVLIAHDHRGGAWYAVDGSQQANYTPYAEKLVNGVDVEGIYDTDVFTWSSAIDDLDDLEKAVED